MDIGAIFNGLDWMLVAKIGVGVVTFAVLVGLWIKTKLTKEDLATIEVALEQLENDGKVEIVSKLAAYAKQAVRAVEQMVAAGLIPKEDQARKDEAVKIVEAEAKLDGVEIDETAKSVVEATIEAEVYQMKQEKK